jgi:hypothetical protein
MVLQTKSTISDVTHYLQTSMATPCWGIHPMVVVKSEDLEPWVLRGSWLVTHRKVNLQLGNDSSIAMKATSHRTMLIKETVKLTLQCECCFFSKWVIKSIPSWTIMHIVQDAISAKWRTGESMSLASISIIVPLGTTNGLIQGSIGWSTREYSKMVPYLCRDALHVE